jgi:predicted  nucleic acid-binding Zn-ribbon protein
MNPIADTLRELHRIHQQLSDLRERIERGPKQIQAREHNVARLTQVLEQVQADAKAARMLADQKQLQLKSDEGKIQDLKVKLNQAKTNREYQALREQIAASEMANSVLADEILDALEKVDELQRASEEARHNVAKGKEELEVTRAAVQGKQEQLIAEVHRLEGELKASEAKLPVDAREGYQRVIRSKGSEGMAQVEGEFCAGCHRQITPNMYNSLRLGQIVFCNSCGRLLYLPEDRSIGSR